MSVSVSTCPRGIHNFRGALWVLSLLSCTHTPPYNNMSYHIHNFDPNSVNAETWEEFLNVEQQCLRLGRSGFMMTLQCLNNLWCKNHPEWTARDLEIHLRRIGARTHLRANPRNTEAYPEDKYWFINHSDKTRSLPYQIEFMTISPESCHKKVCDMWGSIDKNLEALKDAGILCVAPNSGLDSVKDLQSPKFLDKGVAEVHVNLQTTAAALADRRRR